MCVSANKPMWYQKHCNLSDYFRYLSLPIYKLSTLLACVYSTMLPLLYIAFAFNLYRVAVAIPSPELPSSTSTPSGTVSQSTTLDQNPSTSSTPTTSGASGLSLNSTTSTLNQSAPTPSPYFGTNDGHRGLAYVHSGSTQPFALYKSSKVSWAFSKKNYVWSDGSNYNGRIEFVPMLETAAEYDLARWKAWASDSVTWWHSKAVMAFNKPDNCSGGSCLTVNRAVDLYQSYINSDAVGSNDVALGAPAVTSGQGDGVGLSWLREFMEQCARCRIDFVPIYWAGDGSDVAAFKSYLGDAYAAAQEKPLWVIPMNVTGDVTGFLKGVAEFLDTDPRVQRWAWDPERRDPAMNRSTYVGKSLTTYDGSGLTRYDATGLTDLGNFFDGNDGS